MIQNDVLAKFKEIFGDEGDIRVYFAPGRVNLIGEHTDYNGGHVFPCALTIGTYMAARKRTDRKLCFYSMNFDELGVIESSLDAFTPDPDGLWTNYPMGVMWAFEGRGMKLETGLDIALFGNIPNGSGLSSSASLEVVTGYMLKDLYGFDVTNQDLALIGQYSENARAISPPIWPARPPASPRRICPCCGRQSSICSSTTTPPHGARWPCGS